MYHSLVLRKVTTVAMVASAAAEVGSVVSVLVMSVVALVAMRVEVAMVPPVAGSFLMVLAFVLSFLEVSVKVSVVA